MSGKIGPLAWAVCFVLVCAAACTPAKRGAGVVRAQRDALERVSAAYAQDAAMQRAMLFALLRASRERLLARIEEETAWRYIDAAGNARLDSLREDASAGVRTFLTAGALDGAWTIGDAEAALATYAALLNSGAAADERRAPLLALGAAAAHDDAASAVLDAADRRTREVGALLADIGASAGALGALVGASDEPRSIALHAGAALWRTAVLERIDDEERRAAGERALAHAMGVAAALLGNDAHDTKGGGQ